MKAVAGVFQSREDAQHAFSELQAAGFAKNTLALLVPGGGTHQTGTVPVTSTEQPGVAKAVAGAVGAAAGAAGGLELGAAASAVIPGVGPLVATGIIDAALLGLAGASLGIAVGNALENALTEGLPEDELFVYEDALRRAGAW